MLILRMAGRCTVFAYEEMLGPTERKELIACVVHPYIRGAITLVLVPLSPLGALSETGEPCCMNPGMPVLVFLCYEILMIKRL